MSMALLLDRLGWSPAWALTFQGLAPKKEWQPARVSAQHRDQYELLTPERAYVAELAGRLRHRADTAEALVPAVGDWVAMVPYSGGAADSKGGGGQATIQATLPRRSAFVRKAPGGGAFEQVVAANVDTALLVSGLDGNFNPRRIERYLSLTAESGAMPVIVLNKADLLKTHGEREAVRRAVEAIAPGVPVLLVAAARGEGVEYLRDYVPAGQTAVVLGSSGVGKSTVVNALAGREVLTTGAVSAHGSLGRHTTTHRQLVELGQGGMLIDTPGMRELQLWGDEGMLAQSFGAVEELFLQCRFTDCSHASEPGCAVQAALASGALDPDRWASYHKQQRELQFLDRKTSKAAASKSKQRWKTMARANRAADRQTGRLGGG